MSDVAATPSAAPLLFGRYRVSAHLGDTRLVAVYAAADERLQRRVLLHLLRKDLVGNQRARERLVNEAGQMARRSHPAMLEVFDSGVVGERPFLVTEYCTGRPLRGLGMLTAEQALLYLRQLAGAVALCQAQRSPSAPLGLSHPAISSNNVWLVDEGRIKLVESWQPGSSEPLLDQAHYRAPELSQGQPATPATTVYALGLLLFELLTGERPMRGDDARAVALAHLQTRIPALSQARPSLYLPSVERLLARATARAPEHRHPDAQAFANDLDALWRELGTTTQPLSTQARRAAARPVPTRPEGNPALSTPTTPDPQPKPQPVSRPQPRRPEAATPPQPPQGRSQAADPGQLQRQRHSHQLIGWLVMVGLVLLVAGGSFVAVQALFRLERPVVTLPGMPRLPDFLPEQPGDWLEGLNQPTETIYLVNIAEGLNLRSEPDANDPNNILAVIPNGTPVRQLEGPRIEGNIPWLRVRTELDGRTLEGWMSLNYLLPQ
ncbi:MAG: serine/threonine protein kinase [Oscillochloridaceae bacterium umkhey_bin13]